MHQLWFKIALLGDLRFIVPAFVVACIVLWIFGMRRELLAMAIAFLAALALIGVLKYALNPFPPSLFTLGLHAKSAPSGHAGMSTLFYGQVAILLMRLRWAWAKILATLSIGVAALVSLSVWQLWWHSRFDVACGVLVGVAVLLLFDYLRGAGAA